VGALSNSDALRLTGISKRFGGVYTMTVLVEGAPGERKMLERPDSLKAVDKLATFLREQPNVGYVADPAFYIKTRYSFVHGIDKTYFRVPDTRQEIGEGVEAFAAITPGAYDWLYSEDYNSCVITAYCASTGWWCSGRSYTSPESRTPNRSRSSCLTAARSAPGGSSTMYL